MRSGYQVANPRGSEVREKRLAPGAGDPVRNGNAGARLDLHPVECTSRSALTLPVQTRLTRTIHEQLEPGRTRARDEEEEAASLRNRRARGAEGYSAGSGGL